MPVSSKGLNPPGNDKSIVAAAKRTPTCKLGHLGFSWGCVQLKAWNKNPTYKHGTWNKTLLSTPPQNSGYSMELSKIVSSGHKKRICFSENVRT